jgi:hypothetical protein
MTWVPCPCRGLREDENEMEVFPARNPGDPNGPFAAGPLSRANRPASLIQGTSPPRGRKRGCGPTR